MNQSDIIMTRHLRDGGRETHACTASLTAEEEEGGNLIEWRRQIRAWRAEHREGVLAEVGQSLLACLNKKGDGCD